MRNNKLEITGAPKIFIHKATNQMTIYDYKEFTFDGFVVAEACKPSKNILRYQLNDNKIYLE